MAERPQRQIEAAGGALWRPAVGGAGVEVALVHRPKYGDWSLPKGKLAPDEHPLLGALREVEEETGIRALPGRPLGEISYPKDGVPKRVRYWALRAGEGEFLPTREVDQLMWLPPREGQVHLSPNRDRSILAEFARDVEPTVPLLLIRHASAGNRQDWAGADRDRPLDERGAAQAERLVPVLAAYGVQQIFSADVLRCLETVAPYAARRRLTVQSEPLFSEPGFAAHPERAADRLEEIMKTGVPTAVCSQRAAMPDLLAQMCQRRGTTVPGDRSTRRGGWWVLHLACDGPKQRVAAVERFPPVS